MLKYCLTGMLLFSLKVWSQEVPLSVGEKVPRINLITIFNNPAFESNPFVKTDRLVILDFMASNCSSCLKVLPRFDSIQKIYGNTIQIYLVTEEKKDKIKNFLQRHPEIKLPVIGEDTVLSKMFPHTFISHEVWIKEGVVLAITHPEYVTVKNVATALSGSAVHWPVKDDVLEAKLSSTHFPIIDLYLHTYGLYHLPASHIILEVKNKDRFIYSGTGYKTEWTARNTFCMDAVSPDLDNYFGLHGRIEKRKMNFYILRCCGSAPDTNAGLTLHSIAYRLNENNIPVINEAPERQRAPVSPEALKDVSLLKNELKKYGLELVQEEREAEVLVITDKFLTNK